MLLDRPDLVVFCRGLPTAALVRADRKASLSPVECGRQRGERSERNVKDETDGDGTE